MENIEYKTGVYCWLNKVNGKRYVGGAYRSLARRLSQHRNRLHSGKHRNKHLQSAWNKYGQDAFVFEVIERCAAELVQSREQFWIEHYQVTNPRFGYNKSPNAGSQLGFRHSKETGTIISKKAKKRLSKSEFREKISQRTKEGMADPSVRAKCSAKLKEMWSNPEYRKHMVEAHLGQKRGPHSEDHKAKIRASNFGKKRSAEARANISKAQRLRCRREKFAKVLCGDVVARFATYEHLIGG